MQTIEIYDNNLRKTFQDKVPFLCILLPSIFSFSLSVFASFHSTNIFFDFKFFLSIYH
jgi:hypothetical protein